MGKTEMFKKFSYMPWILFFFIFASACENTDYDLLDPVSAGKWTYFNTKTGLPGDQVRDIKLDSKNNIWFTFSGNGAATYSNNVWTTYKTTNSSILNNNVICIAENASGTIIFGTSNGLSYKAANGQWSSYTDPLATMYVVALKVASNGWIWVGTINQGFYINDGSGFENVYVSSFKNVNVIEEGIPGNIWLGTDNGLIKWDRTSFTLTTTSGGLPDNEVTALFYDSQKRLWIGTNGGSTVSWIDEKGTMHQLSLLNGSQGTFVRDIYEDRKGDIWFATWLDGLIQYDGVVPKSYKKYNGFPENDINTIGGDKYGNLWFGLYSKGLAEYTLPLD
jgi:ligand-binding sensor domain-containing protein